MFQCEFLNKITIIKDITCLSLNEQCQLNLLREICSKKKKFDKGAIHGAMLSNNKGKIISVGTNFNASKSTRLGALSFHAEYSCFQQYQRIKLPTRHTIMYNVRICKKTGNFMNSAPCHMCFQIICKYIIQKKICKFIFTISEKQVGIIQC